jgi:hypothetical protein
MQGWLRQGVGVVLTMGAALAMTGTARGQDAVSDPVIAENIDGVVEWYSTESGSNGTGCYTVCQALTADLRRAPTALTDPVEAPALRSLIDPSRELTRIKPPWPWKLGRISVIGGLVWANYYVWKVKVLGAHPKDYYVKVPQQAFSLADVDSWAASDGIDTTLFPTYYDLPSPLPVGLVALSRYRGAVLWQTGINPATGAPSRCGEAAPATTPAFVSSYSWHWNRCFEGYFNNQEVYSDLTANGWKISLDGLLAGSWNLPGAPDSPDTFTVIPQPLSRTDITQRLADLLNSSDEGYATLRRWLNSNLGGDEHNPKDDYYTTPTCSGVSVATCTSRLRAAGFTGTITTRTLSTADAVVEFAGGQVTDTAPTADQQIAEGTGFTLYVNPNKLPKMTATETSIADTLQTQNPDTVTDSNKKTLARTCVKYALAAAKPTANCTSMPMFVQGNDVPTIAVNEATALARNPAWFVLNRREAPTRTDTPWYYDQAEPAPGCLQSQKPPTLSSCDEFPFWSTPQAFGGPLATAVPGIRWTPRSEQSKQGGHLNAFYNTKCNIPLIETSGPVASSFLNMATAPGVPIPTLKICNATH